MNGNKFTKTSWIILGIGFALAIIGIFSMAANPDVGAWLCIIGLGGAMLYLFWLIIKSILATKEPGKTGLKFIGILVAEFAVIGLGIALDLGAVGTGILAAVIFIVGLCIKGAIDNTACPKCGKKLSMKEISRKTTGSYATTMDVRREVKNSKGEVIRTYYEAVPATKYYYDCVDECKFCGHRQEVRRQSTLRD